MDKKEEILNPREKKNGIFDRVFSYQMAEKAVFIAS